MRAFIALPVPEVSRSALCAAQARMRSIAEGSPLRPRFAVREQLHVTLKFLGDVPQDSVDELRRVVGEHARTTGPVSTRWTAPIAFGGPRRARAIVAGVHDPDGALAALASSLEAACEALGVPREERRFRPHVTLARIKLPGDVQRWLQAAALEALPVRFDEIRLYQSRLGSDGGVYTVLAGVPLVVSPPPG